MIAEHGESVLDVLNRMLNKYLNIINIWWVFSLFFCKAPEGSGRITDQRPEERVAIVFTSGAGTTFRHANPESGPGPLSFHRSHQNYETLI